MLELKLYYARKRGELMKKYMAIAIKEALGGISKGDGGPFGACITLGGKVLAVGHNTVLKRQDSTCHAEINVIREASKRLGRFDLSDCRIYTTTEPCPMCLSAIHWARIQKVIFGTTIEDVHSRGFNELLLKAEKLIRISKSKITVKQKFRGDCLELLKAWDAKGNRKVY